MNAILETLDRLGITAETHRHPAAFTVADAREHWATIPAAHAKNLLLKDAGGAYWLVSMPAEATLDLKTLPARIGSKRLRFAPPDDVERLLAVRPGAVSALAIVNDRHREVRLVIDSRLLAGDRVAFHPADNCLTTVLSPDGLRRFLAADDRAALEIDLSG